MSQFLNYEDGLQNLCGQRTDFANHPCPLTVLEEVTLTQTTHTDACTLHMDKAVQTGLGVSS